MFKLVVLAIALALHAASAEAQEWTPIPGTPPVYVQPIKPAATPAPIVIMLHGGSGLDTDQVNAFAKWSSWLSSQGVGALIVDSYRGRNLRQFQSTGDRTAYMAMLRQRVGDLQRVVDWARSQPWIDQQRIATFGQSQGAIVATLAALETTLRLPEIGFYNGCDARYFDSKPVPTSYPPSLSLLGADDKVTPAANCEALRARMGTAGQAIRLIVFPGATHTFDWYAAERTWNGNTVRYSTSADQGAQAAIADFLRSRRFIR
ncbi:dienelactone hydrolase family protein [Reyranella soli]|uniref:dienelactone hydrolase family protein n=1 Tax=Reyranella soli TaxID=1230389 RepID=UPI0011BEAE6D|nr:dienelactone hydrolase family protein [Reyranella soli]